MMNDGVQATMPMMPANTTNDGMMGGGSWIWIILIFLLLGGAGLGGLGNNGGVVASPATNLINNDFLYTQSKIDALGQALINQTNQLNQSLNAGINSVNSGICNLSHRMDMGFCDTNRNIDGVKFQMAQDKCDITTAIGASTQTMLNYMTGQEIANWRERALSAENRENNANQTAAIINQLRPYPTAAYLTANPNVPFGAYPPAPFFGGYGGHCGHDHCGCNPCC